MSPEPLSSVLFRRQADYRHRVVLGLMLISLSVIAAEPVSESTLTFDGKIISGGSALFMIQGDLYVVSDNQNDIYRYGNGNLAAKLQIFMPTAADPTEDKRDLEAAVILPARSAFPYGSVLLIPSGSKKDRDKGALVYLAKDGSLSPDISLVDFSYVYDGLQDAMKKVNIEGAIVRNNKLMLFQRGNSKQSINAIVTLDIACLFPDKLAHILRAECIRDIAEYDLGELDGVPYTFNDALLIDNEIYFLAAAEATEDATLDGDVSGSILGKLNPNMEIAWVRKLSDKLKLEGMAAKPDTKAGAPRILYLISDPDDNEKSSELFSIELDWN